jgi:hypothetical protein
MTYVILRDDDANATSDPDRIARVYAPLFDAGIPVSFSVIPEVALDTRAPDGRREAFLHPDWPSSPECAPLTPEVPMAIWLGSNAAHVDVLQHGTTHARVAGGSEFGALPRADAAALVARGYRTLTNALGTPPVGFVAPWDQLSAGALEVVTSGYPLLSTGWVSLDNLPARAWSAHLRERLRRDLALRVGGCWVLRHRGCKIDGRLEPAAVPAAVDALTAGARAAVIVLHHWMYWDRPEPHPAIVALARALRGRTCVRARDLPALLDAPLRAPTDRPPPLSLRHA